MSEVIEKLRPDRDLVSYFFRPSAVAALSATSETGFTLSGSWRQQFDWAVVEWNRDSVFEHPTLRPLPDGDLSGLTLSYKEQRSNCIPLDSGLFPTVSWPYLRIWAQGAGGGEQVYRVPLKDHAIPVSGAYEPAFATFTLGGSLTAGDVVELSWPNEHYFHTIQAADTFETVLLGVANEVNALSPTMSAAVDGATASITLASVEGGDELNRLGVIAATSVGSMVSWSPHAQRLTGGASPSEWEVTLDFSNLQDIGGEPIPTQSVRKMRWTYAAALQDDDFIRSDFLVKVRDWQVVGTNRTYAVAGPGSVRFEDTEWTYGGTWQRFIGNFSNATIHKSTTVGSSARLEYQADSAHELYLGTRKTFEAGMIEVKVDGAAPKSIDLFQAGEDYLVRIPLGPQGPGTHSIDVALTGENPLSGGNSLYLDFAEAAQPATTVSAKPLNARVTLATDWDTDHSLALPPERVLWNLQMLGFLGRANHYVGAILFYELRNKGNVFAEGLVRFEGTPVFSQNVTLTIDGTVFQRLTLSTDTAETVAKSFEYRINQGATGIRAIANGSDLRVLSRQLGTAGNSTTFEAAPTDGPFRAVVSGPFLAGGVDDEWVTDTASLPRHNRAAIDWHREYFRVLHAAGVDVAAAFSTELSHGDRSVEAGIAQRYPLGDPVELNTPAIQTNFSPTSIAYWQETFLEMARLQNEVGLQPFLQFGETQWWYFPNNDGMPFYDAENKARFESEFGRPLQVFTSNENDPEAHPEDVAYLARRIGDYTAAIRAHVLAELPNTRFEVLYPHDVNDFPLTRVVNFADSDWTPENLDILKTENFIHTGNRDMNKALESIRLPFAFKGFARSASSHLIGVLSSFEPWDLERRLSEREGVESIVFWAFDQFSMIGFPVPLKRSPRRSRFLG